MGPPNLDESMAIRDWPKSERPREKLIAQGARSLSEAELLAVILGCGPRGSSALQLARDLLSRFGSLRELLNAEPGELLELPGVGAARYCTLQAALELARRHYRDGLRIGSIFEKPADARAFLVSQLRDRPYEVFCCLHLDNRHRLLAFDEVFRGTIDGAIVHPREVVRQALIHNSAAVLFAHNHPSGISEPSQADRLITRRLREALALVDVRVVDHVIVGGGDCVSLCERGLC